ncbi:MAG: gliding motility-associated C-terminal domain-containing protein, partial [Flavobacteriales bacterium]
LTGNELHLNHNINILTETEYLVHLKAYDGVAYSIDSIFTIKLNNTNTPPTAIELSANVVYDYSTPGDVVGNISVADENDDAVYTLSPLDSTALDNSKFSLVGTTLILDHQVDASIESVYQVQLKAYDGVAYWITDTLSIVVNNTNIFPYSLDVSGLSVYDYSVVGDTVGMLSVQDANIGETYTYTMTPNPSFFLLGNHIVLNQNINVLNDTSFDVTISAYDGSTWTIDSTYTVNVVNTNAEPTEVTISNAVIYDHTLPATLVGTFAVTDANGNIPYDYTLQNSYNSNLFQIVDNKLFLMGNVDPQIGSYQIEVSAYDGVLWTIDSLFTITVTNTNIEPTAIHISNDTIFNYTTPGDVVGYFNVDDVNAGTSYTYSLGTSLNESLFTIIGNTLKCNATIDPQAGSYQIQVSAFDGSQWTIDSVMTIVVNNTNEVPTAINLSNTTITDQTMVGDVVGGLTVTDANATEVYTYSINSAIQDGSLFQIVGNDLQFTGTVDPQIGSYQVQIEAYDGSQWTIDSLFTITVNNTNAVPTAIHLSNTEISDLTQAGDAVGQLSVTDANATETYTYSITTAIQDGSLFQVVGNELQFTGTVDPQAGSYQVQVEAYDGSQWMIDSLFTITVNNTNVKPTVFNLSATQVTDQTTTGSQVGTLSVTDANATENYTYTIKTGYNADHFQLVGNSLQFVGQVDVSKANYQVELEAYDGKLWTIDSVFTINVNNTNAAPTAITLSNNVITDMSGVGSEIGTFAVVDADASETYELTLSTELDGDKFSLVNDKLVFLTSFDPSETSYHIKISGYDGRQHSIDSTFTIEVNNTNPAPESLSISNNNIDENAPSQTLAGELTVADNGFNEVHTFELTFTEGENDNFEFELIGNKIYSKTSFDYENQTEYTVEVTVTDVVNNTLTEVFTINVNDVLEVDVLENNNYLTPNADGVNDVWEVENVELYENFTLNIYNKQGQSVYQTTGYNNTWSGSDLPTGIYFYHFKSNKNSVEFSGNIHLIK